MSTARSRVGDLDNKNRPPLNTRSARLCTWRSPGKPDHLRSTPSQPSIATKYEGRTIPGRRRGAQHQKVQLGSSSFSSEAFEKARLANTRTKPLYLPRPLHRIGLGGP